MKKNENLTIVFDTQSKFEFWDKTINKKLLEAKEKRLEIRNEWIRKNLKNYHIPYVTKTEEDEANIKALL